MSLLDVRIGVAEYGTLDKARFVAIALPLLGLMGGAMHTLGWSDQGRLLATVPILVGAFFASHLHAIDRVSRKSELAGWQDRDARLRKDRESIVAGQQEELTKLRLRQESEQRELIRRRASGDELTGMMDRHRHEYEGMLRKLSA